MVWAQPVPAAESLYHRGVADFQAGRYELACQELADSYRLEALPGVLFTLATCEARAGRVASSAAHFQDFLSLVSTLPPEQRALQREREQVARAERSALLASIPTLTVSVAGGVPEGAVVHCDGAALGPSSLDRALPLDPGVHSLSLTLRDGAKSEQGVELEKGAHVRVTLTAPAPLAVAAPLRDPLSDTPSRPRQLRPWMIAAGVLAGAGIATGTAAGVLALNQKKVVDDHCRGTDCDAKGKDAADLGKTQAHLSTIGFGVGIAGLTAMLVLHLTNRQAKQRAQALSGLTVTPQGLAFGAEF